MTVLLALSPLFLTVAGLGALVILAWAAKKAQWRTLAALSLRQHLWFGAIVLLSVFWSYVRITVDNSIILHPLLIASCTIIFGFRLALITGTLALIGHQLIVHAPWPHLPANFWITVFAPAITTKLVLYAIARSRIKNLFLYTLGGGFFGGMLSMLSCGVASLAVLYFFSDNDFVQIWEKSYLFLLLVFPEGFCNGTIVTSLAVMKPELVKTYNDDFYLGKD